MIDTSDNIGADNVAGDLVVIPALKRRCVEGWTLC